MPLFDLRTVVLMSSVMPGLMAIALFSLARSFPVNIRGIRQWASGSLIVSASAVLLALRGEVPDWLSILVANAGIMSGTSLGLIGSQLFFGRPVTWRSVAIVLLLGTAGTAWYWLVEDSVAARAACVTGVLALLYGAHGRVMLRYGRPGHSAMALGAMLLAECAVALMRFATVVAVPGSLSGFFQAGPLHTFYLMAGAFFSLVITVGFLLVAMDRLRTQLEQQSYRDPLTGLQNRRAFAAAFEKEREQTSRTGGVLSMLLLDLDHFKHVNDQHGHDAGDRVLVDFAQRTASVLSTRGHLCRWGGEEFAVLLPDMFADEACLLAGRIRMRVSDQGPGASAIHYTCSAGVACMAAAHATLEELARDADAALYRAKDAGRNRVEISDQAYVA